MGEKNNPHETVSRQQRLAQLRRLVSLGIGFDELVLARLVQPAAAWGRQARLKADGARAEPLVGSPNSCWNALRMRKEG
jgi:hypothetical protein